MDENNMKPSGAGTPYGQPNVEEASPKGKAIASLVLSILGFAFVLVPFLDLILSIVATVLGSSAKESDGRRSGIATAGMVVGIIGIVVNAIYSISWIILAAIAVTAGSLIY